MCSALMRGATSTVSPPDCRATLLAEMSATTARRSLSLALSLILSLMRPPVTRGLVTSLTLKRLVLNSLGVCNYKSNTFHRLIRRLSRLLFAAIRSSSLSSQTKYSAKPLPRKPSSKWLASFAASIKHEVIRQDSLIEFTTKKISSWVAWK